MCKEEVAAQLMQFVKEYGMKRNEIENSIREQHQAEDAATPRFDTDEERGAWQKKTSAY